MQHAKVLLAGARACSPAEAELSAPLPAARSFLSQSRHRMVTFAVFFASWRGDVCRGIVAQWPDAVPTTCTICLPFGVHA